MSMSNPSKTRMSKAGGPLAAQLHFEKKNKKQPRLPPNVVVQRRPINHPPIANPYAGAYVPKVVYVATSTPLMAAVKRVRKLLGLIEKRAMSRVKLPDPKHNAKKGEKRFLEAIDSVAKEVGKEAVYVKASGRAVEKALKIGEWLKEKEDGMTVEVKTGSTIVVDNLIEVQPEHSEERIEITGDEQMAETDTRVELNEKSKDVFALDDMHIASAKKQHDEHQSERDLGNAVPSESSTTPSSKKPKRKRKRDMYDVETMPEARTRWIKTVEVAVCLKG